MSVEVVIPSPGESITEVTLGQWLCNDGDWVAQDDNLVEIESDKVTLEIPAPASGVLRITAEAGAEMEVGDIVATIDTDATAPSGDQGSDAQAADPGDSGPASVVEAATAAAAEETLVRPAWPPRLPPMPEWMSTASRAPGPTAE